MADRGRPKVNKRRQRVASSFLTKSLDDINREIRIEQERHKKNSLARCALKELKRVDAERCFQRYKGRCVYCDKPLSYLGRKSLNSARLAFYVPLNVGGKVREDNLIVVCFECMDNYRSTRKMREDIVGLDTFADTCEALFIAVSTSECDAVVSRLKHKLNSRLSDVATCMRYITMSDWTPADTHLVVEDENTIGDRLEQMAKGEDVKDEITQDMKQIVSTKKYRIIRKQDEPS